MHAWHKHHQKDPPCSDRDQPSPTWGSTWLQAAGRKEGAESQFVGSGEDLELREHPESPGYQKQTTSKPRGQSSKAEHCQTL